MLVYCDDAHTHTAASMYILLLEVQHMGSDTVHDRMYNIAVNRSMNAALLRNSLGMQLHGCATFLTNLTNNTQSVLLLKLKRFGDKKSCWFMEYEL